MVVKKNCFFVFSILIVGKEAICPDGLFVPAVFRESDFYLNSLIFLVPKIWERYGTLEILFTILYELSGNG